MGNYKFSIMGNFPPLTSRLKIPQEKSSNCTALVSLVNILMLPVNKGESLCVLFKHADSDSGCRILKPVYTIIHGKHPM